MTDVPNGLEANGNQNFRTLLDFSLARIDDRQAMQALGIDSDEDLFLLMAQATYRCRVYQRRARVA